jgi:predicted Zn-ribbon and HTH transcriptional regulator
MTGTAKTKSGITTHRCRTCGRRFEGTGKRGRPFSRCPECRAKRQS